MACPAVTRSPGVGHTADMPVAPQHHPRLHLGKLADNCNKLKAHHRLEDDLKLKIHASLAYVHHRQGTFTSCTVGACCYSRTVLITGDEAELMGPFWKVILCPEEGS